ncbi:MAG: molybdopterin-dependent oxidoreductase, partial [Gemmatimonadetes bacterium]|nr:molybdopterin-dependent oxidoreductase [Gemmatimonadota bacterium]
LDPGRSAMARWDVAGHDGIILVLGDELQDQDEDFGTNASLFVYMGTADSPAARNADFVLPVTTFAEEEGSFVNVQGRVQRFLQGLQAPGYARPAWLVLGALAGALRGEGTPASAAEAFDRVVAAHAAFSGLTWEAIGDAGARLEAAHA